MEINMESNMLTWRPTENVYMETNRTSHHWLGDSIGLLDLFITPPSLIS